MTTLVPDNDEHEVTRRGHGRITVVRASYLLAGVGFLAIVLLTLLNVFAEIDSTVASAITAIGTLMTAAFGVAALYLRRH
ncbi:hypothetical protein [Micromonospora cathayae]|uniref:Holin-X, holin superfamily III n=1 Tax=Micromonospora cathayae TaxID=3028804 RepID=A0ABY7ZIZ2_9ACTN|nr:hypothetical protein [Micromonospora sp. HUAS 3]WDZ82488.1 hypothetical protein PVK37_18580 [Micromonospora sp. HUAS 3]